MSAASLPVPTEEQFNEWRQGDVARWFFEYLQTRRTGMGAAWAKSFGTDAPAEALKATHDGLVHRSNTLEQVIGAEYLGICDDLDVKPRGVQNEL